MILFVSKDNLLFLKLSTNQFYNKVFQPFNHSQTIQFLKKRGQVFQGLSQGAYNQNYKAKVDNVFKLELLKVK